MDPRETALDPEGLTRTVIGLLGPRAHGDTHALEESMRAAFDGMADADFERLQHRIETTGDRWGYHPPDPGARRLSRAILDVLLAPGSTLHDAENLGVARKEPVILLGNHLSFADANDLDQLIAASGFGDVAEKMTTVVGPKVYTRPLRRLASLCFGTVKIPQSTSRATDEAVMGRREVARIATETIRVAHARQEEGEHLLIYIEGTRSRTGSMQRGLAAVGRYLIPPARVLIPVGIWGSETLVPIGDEQLHSGRAEARIGRPVVIDDLFERCRGRRPLAVDVIGFLIAHLVPPAYRGFYGEPTPSLSRASDIAREIEENSS